MEINLPKNEQIKKAFVVVVLCATFSDLIHLGLDLHGRENTLIFIDQPMVLLDVVCAFCRS